MTHEYGHFNMCSMLYTEDGPNALRGLIQRIFDGDDSRDDDMAIMLEAVADTFSMQVVGGANYLRPLGSYANFNRELVMGFCVEAPCMDFNYGGGGEYQPDSDFHDELARYVSLIHDVFDRADGNNRLAAQPWNGDVWRDFSTQGLTFSPTGYIAHDDEPVSLPGSAWKDWIVKWLERGRNPTLSNILGGLVDTMEQHEVNWCDRCEVFAAHHQATPPVARMLNPADSSSSIRTFDIRHQRWETCAADAWLEDWVGGVPRAFASNSHRP